MSYLTVFLQGPSAPSQVQFFTVGTLFTAAGATTAVISLTSVLHSLFSKLPARWFALGLSLALTLLGISVQDQHWRPLTIFVALINGLVVYAAAVGVNNVMTTPPAPGGPPVPAAPAAFAAIATGRRSLRWWP